MNVEKTLFWYISALTILSLIAWQITLICGQYLGAGYPYDIFLYRQPTVVPFDDFTRFGTHLHLWKENGLIKAIPLNHLGYPFYPMDEYSFKTRPPMIYSPLGTYSYLLFYFLYPSKPVYALLLSIFLTACATSILLAYKLRHSPMAGMFGVAIIITMLTSYPLMFELDRANIEGFAWIFSCLGIISFINNKYMISGILLAISAIKFYTGIFLLLFLAKKRYTEFVISVIFLIWLHLFSAYELSGNIFRPFFTLSEGVSSLLRDHVILGRMLLEFDVSLFAVIKQIFFVVHLPVNMFVYYLYTLVSIGGFVALYILKARHLPLLNQLFIFTVAIILLPYVSMMYKLLYLTTAWGGFMVFLAYDAKPTGFSTKQALHILISVAILFTPQTYLISNEIGGFGGQIKAIVLLYLLVFVVRNPMHSPTLFRE